MFSDNQPLNVDPASVATSTSYEQPDGGDVVVTIPPQAPPVMPQRPQSGMITPQRTNMETVLNNYYRFQVLGFLYKQG